MGAAADNLDARKEQAPWGLLDLPYFNGVTGKRGRNPDGQMSLRDPRCLPPEGAFQGLADAGFENGLRPGS